MRPPASGQRNNRSRGGELIIGGAGAWTSFVLALVRSFVRSARLVDLQRGSGRKVAHPPRRPLDRVLAFPRSGSPKRGRLINFIAGPATSGGPVQLSGDSARSLVFSGLWWNMPSRKSLAKTTGRGRETDEPIKAETTDGS